jgi:hypothetical protein
MRVYLLNAVVMVLCLGSFANATTLEDLPLLPGDEAVTGQDWLVHSVEQKAAVYRLSDGNSIVLSNGLLRRTFRIAPNAATVGLENLVSGESLLRGVKPEAVLVINGQRIEVGGLKGQPNYAFLRADWIDTLESVPEAMQFSGFTAGVPAERMPWKQVRHHAPDAVWPPKGVSLEMNYVMPDTVLPSLRDVQVTVHYELYDGIPLFCKWITVQNAGKDAVLLDSFTSEILAAVEYSSDVEDREGKAQHPNLHVETDYAFLAMSALNAGRHAIRWLPDPDYGTQVNYELKNPCLLEVGPDLGPAATIAPGETFTSFHTFVLSFDGYDRERNGLAQRRMYRVVAPWATENPLMMHVRYSDPKTVYNAIDQCAEVGFEMVILTFGSGFEIENDRDRYLKRMGDYTTPMPIRKGIEIGGYSLLASRQH